MSDERCYERVKSVNTVAAYYYPDMYPITSSIRPEKEERILAN